MRPIRADLAHESNNETMANLSDSLDRSMCVLPNSKVSERITHTVQACDTSPLTLVQPS